MPKVIKKNHSSSYTPHIKDKILSVLKKPNKESQLKSTLVSLDKPYKRTADYFDISVRTLKKWEKERNQTTDGVPTELKNVSVAFVIIIIQATRYFYIIIFL